mgnify:CR=1 FL=1
MLYLCSGHISIISCPTNAGLLSVYNLFAAKKRGGPEKVLSELPLSGYFHLLINIYEDYFVNRSTRS